MMEVCGMEIAESIWESEAWNINPLCTVDVQLSVLSMAESALLKVGTGP